MNNVAAAIWNPSLAVVDMKQMMSEGPVDFGQVVTEQEMVWLLLVVGCWLLVVGCWLLVVGCWLLVVGCWLLVVGCWLLV